MDLIQFKQLCKSFTAIPVYRRLLADFLTPVSLYLHIREHARLPFLLESVEGGEQLARYSFLGRNPYQWLTFDGKTTTLHFPNEKKEVCTKPYFNVLEQLTTCYSEPKLAELPRLTGGAVGFSSYDTIREVEKLKTPLKSGLKTPEANWAFYDEIFAFDHVKHQIVLIKTIFPENYDSSEEAYAAAQNALDEMESATKGMMPEMESFSIDVDSLKSNMQPDYFEEIVKKAKRYIFEGDIFQVVLSQRFQADFSGDAFMLYRALRMVNPSPYLFFIDYGDFSLIGSSPEVLVSVQDKEVRVLPIAGTRKRGKTYDEDLALEKDLLADEKELSEHVMLVDLGRNDLSRVCEAGTVSLKRDHVIERYSHVMHIVSEVTGVLANGKSSVEALKRCFPAGTVSGAPKIRAMEIIDELEPSKRGIYAGAVGYFDFSGNMDTCIAIRTMVATKNKVYIQAGAGIVADSIPKNEFEETRNKAEALVEALSLALSL